MNKTFIYIVCAALMCSTSFAYSQTEETGKKEKTEKKEDKKSATVKEKKGKRQFLIFGKRKAVPQKPAEPKPSIDRNGLFHVTKLGQDWFFELPDSLLSRQFLTTTRYTSLPSSTGKFAGELLNEQTICFEKISNDQLVMRAVLLVNYADTANNINKAVTISNGNPIIASFKIESHKDKVIKFKVAQFFNEDNPAIGISQAAKKSFNLTNMLPNLSYIEDIKSFPLNTEVRLVKTFNSTSTSIPAVRATGKATFGLNISFILLPEKPLMPRFYDPRVGYFTESFNEFTDAQQRVKSKTYITRYRLEPRPEDVEKMQRGELVEPAKPIIYYIDPATPKQWVPYLIQGVNDWQVAFEKAGFKNAIIGKEWPNDSTMSMEDARYCVIRYLASPIENAYGPHVSDPRTGEILESHICWYHNVMKLVHDWYMVQAGSIDEAAQKMHYDTELMGQLIRFVSSHEVGHTLGLRHNFGASSTVPVENLRNKQWVEKYGHTPSIMDYARFNYVAQPEDGISHEGIFPRINDYDIWAIEWGYKPMFGATSPETDHSQLEQLVAQRLNGNPRLWWGDGEGYSKDPRRQTEDLGDDAVKASEYGILNLKRELQKLPQWTYTDDDYYNSNLSEVFNQIYSQFMRYNGHVINNIGGTYMNFKTPDEQGAIYRPTPREKQKSAMEYISRNIFTEPTWLTQVDYIDRLTDNPQRITIGSISNLMNKLFGRLDMLNNEYTAEEYISDLTQGIMTELDSRKPVSKYRAELQNSFVDHLISIYTDNAKASSASNYRPYVVSTLRQLLTRTATASKSATDSATKAHFLNLNDIIANTMEHK